MDAALQAMGITLQGTDRTFISFWLRCAADNGSFSLLPWHFLCEVRVDRGVDPYNVEPGGAAGASTPAPAQGFRWPGAFFRKVKVIGFDVNEDMIDL